MGKKSDWWSYICNTHYTILSFPDMNDFGGSRTTLIAEGTTIATGPMFCLLD